VNFDPSVFLKALVSRPLQEGVVQTIVLTFISIAFGLLIGVVIALLRDSRNPVARGFAWTYVWIFRAVPTIVLLLFVWNAMPQLIPALKGPGFTSFMAAAIALSVNEGAYAAEIVRGGLLSIDEGQRLAARALGMPPVTVFRRIVTPQLARVIIPPMSNDFITMLKITSLAYIISLRELLNNAQIQISSTYRFAEYYLAVAIYYLVIVSIFMVLQAQLEKRFEWRSRAAGRGGAARIRSVTALR
jgi:polar amino acid transport system permease protein